MTEQKLIIFGAGDIAQLAHHYFSTDSNYEPVAFCVDREFLPDPRVFCDLPVYPLQEIAEKCPPSSHRAFVALSYADMNRRREKKLTAMREAGYDIASYVSSRATYLAGTAPGENAFILEDNTIQPFVTIGENVTLWSGNHVGHHSTIQSHNFVSSHVVISGHCTIEPHCFLGVNSTVGHRVRLSEGTLLGANAVVTKDTKQFGVYVPPRSTCLGKPSDEVDL